MSAKERENSRLRGSIIPGTDKALAWYRERIAKGQLDSKTYKVTTYWEKDEDGVIRRKIRIAYLEGDKIWEERGRQYRAETEKRLPLGQDVGAWKRIEVDVWRRDLRYFYYNDIEFVGTSNERFRTGTKAKACYAGFTVFEIPGGHRLDEHEFLRRVIDHQKLHASNENFGRVVRGIDDRGSIRMTWISGENIAVYCSLNPKSDYKPLLEAFGRKYPSRLSKDFKVDKTAWGREEVDRWIARTHHIFDKGENYLQYGGHGFGLTVAIGVRRSLFVPGLAERLEALSKRPRHLDSNRYIDTKREILKFVEDWWSANKEKTYWDDEYGQLVVKGQTPKDILRQRYEERKRREAAELEAALNKPFTAEDRAKVEARFRKILIKKINRQHAISLDIATPEHRDKVKLEQTAPDTWRLTWYHPSNSTVYVDTFTGPFFAEYPSRQYPYKAWYKWDHPIQSLLTRTYYYDKLADKWSSPAKSRLKPDLPAKGQSREDAGGGE